MYEIALATRIYLLKLSIERLKERSIPMFDPIDSQVQSLMGNVRFLDVLISRARLILGTAGVIGLLVLVVLILK
jgi:hypothetical protein